MTRWLTGCLVGALLALPAAAQDSGVAAACRHAEVPASARESCAVVAQAAHAAQPQLGILLAGGNPTPGAAAIGGLGLGVLPRVSASARLGLVRLRLPDVLAGNAAPTAGRLGREIEGLAPAVSGTVAVGLVAGANLAPTVGGVGAVDLLGSVGWLPLAALGPPGFDEGSAALSYGAGVRLGLLRESFTLPGLSLSWMYRAVGRVGYGDVCPGAAAAGAYVERGTCAGGGDPGEFALDLSSWSGRGLVSKRLPGVGLAAGIGYDAFRSDASLGFRAPGEGGAYTRFHGLTLGSGRWSAFANGSFSMLAATVAAEAGWQQGGEPVPGFPSDASDFDPRRGTWFGSLGLRLAL